MCSECNGQLSEVVVLPGDNPDIQMEYLCSRCFSQYQGMGYSAFPYNFLSSDGENAIGNPHQMEEKCAGLIMFLYEYQEQVKLESAVAVRVYTDTFEKIFKELRDIQDKVMAVLSESKVMEIERANDVILDLKTIQQNATLSPEVAYISTWLNQDFVGNAHFIAYPEDIDQYVRMVLTFPEPKVASRIYKPEQSAQEQQETIQHRRTMRLIEDNSLIMPIDTRNFLVTEFTGSQPTRKMVPCSAGFPYRVNARWCRIDDSLYLYTGGLFRDAPVNWCDLIDTSAMNSAEPNIVRIQAQNMGVARHRHAVICHDRIVYAFGGTWIDPAVENTDRGIERTVAQGNWTTSSWVGIGEMENVSDLTATILKGIIYLAGSGRSLYKFDTFTQRLDKINILRMRDLLEVSPSDPTEPLLFVDSRQPLPRQSSNSLIFAWESQVMILQHDTMFCFSPGQDKVEMAKKKVGVVKSWCSPFPAVLKGSKCYFMLEPTETDLMPAGDVWVFDFIKKEVNLVSFDKK